MYQGDNNLTDANLDLLLIKIRGELERHSADMTKWSIVLWVTAVGTILLIVLASK